MAGRDVITEPGRVQRYSNGQRFLPLHEDRQISKLKHHAVRQTFRFNDKAAYSFYIIQQLSRNNKVYTYANEKQNRPLIFIDKK